ncbi:CG13203 [Drosophila busckii]|uniref:CG13203 n=1 Tax=Drosophila busckii TaxID=30019 RepID=A0A0M4EG26_DROBS|nr:uncharacterized protein LOC108594736 [Drosophila busckii]ALC41285.1 CG13203 [Drosophila busckii]
MSLSLVSRRRFQTPSTATATTTTTTTPSVRKQHSFIESSSHAHSVSRYTAQQRGYLSRGLSVGRSIENIRQKLYAPAPVRRQPTLGLDEATSRINARLSSTKAELGLRLSDKSLVAWSSTTSLLKSTPQSAEHDQEQRIKGEAEDNRAEHNAKADKNRINLNIVLAQTIRATNEQDIDSASESVEQGNSNSSATTTTTATTVGRASAAADKDNVGSALTVQRRPPLVRAMSAPVRLDESKCIASAASKRQQQKLRRRKIFTRTASSAVVTVPADSSSSLLSSDATGSSQKKPLSRARSVVSADVITLVSLLSSEGSDSEREESSSATPTGNDSPGVQGSQRSPQRRAPLLRKTGKSVSFQDSYPPTFQLASKEYSHMIRRGSIAPLAARIRANRPPTAPPVSIFLSESAGSKATMESLPQQQQQQQSQAEADSPTEESKKENQAGSCNVPQPEYNYPLYVCSIKERECWKLYQKMCAKGVSVSYDTVLRGMLTPTEFRHFQKQREHEETKAQQAAEAAAEAAAADEKETRKTPATAIERLSESLLQSK